MCSSDIADENFACFAARCANDPKLPPPSSRDAVTKRSDALAIPTSFRHQPRVCAHAIAADRRLNANHECPRRAV